MTTTKRGSLYVWVASVDIVLSMVKDCLGSLSYTLIVYDSSHGKRTRSAQTSKKKMILKILIEEHKEKFGREPVILDLDLHDTETLIALIMKAIAENKPYDESEQLSEE